MKEVINLITISPFISTTYHLAEFNLALDKLQQSFFQKNQNLIETLEQEIPFPLSDNLKKLALENEVNLQNIEQVNEFINKIRDEVRQIKRLTLTIGISPTLKLIQAINRWIILNIKQVVVLEFVTDKTIVAGARIEFDGKITDYSVRKQMLENIKIPTDEATNN
ncbi:MAG TPA: F0F1 ATP synthase subunit delta [Patescibacteria group bacterium]